MTSDTRSPSRRGAAPAPTAGETRSASPARPAAPASGPSRHVRGTWRLLRLAVRRDRAKLTAWVLVLGVLTSAVVSSITALYTTAEERVTAAAFAASNVVARVFDGPASGTELGALTFVEAFQVVAILTALMAAQTVVRHTRQEEETGRSELIGSAVVGRSAPLTAALLVAATAVGVVGATVALVLFVNDLPAVGSVAAGLAVAGVGWVFAAVGAVAAQVASTQRAANAMAGAVLGAVFLLRAVGDAMGEVADSGVEVVSAWPSWLSPIGWGQQVQPFHADRWWVFALFAGLTVGLVAVAYALAEHRDLGAGIVATRPGPATASASLRTPIGMAWRLHRSSLLGWAVGVVVLGAAFGLVGESADELMAENDAFQDVMAQIAAAGGLTELYVAFAMAFLAIAVAAAVVQTLLRARSEEAAGRLEPLLSTAVGRGRWLASHGLWALVAAVGLSVLVGGSAALAYGAATGDWGDGFAWFLGAAFAQLPAVLAIGAIVVAAFGLVPRYAVTIGWGVLGASLVFGQLGSVLDLPQAVLNLSPFTHVPAVPADPVAWTPLVVLVAVTVASTVLGALAFRRRDLAIAA